jgi:peroxiredoxin
LGLAAISYDARPAITAFAEQNGITFPMLSDEGSETIRRYGILNPVAEWALGPNSEDPAMKADIQTYVSVVNPSARMVGIAFPGTFMLDPEGRVTSRHFEELYIERNTVSSVLLRRGDAAEPVNAVRLSTAQVDITTFPTDAEVAPGNRFALVLDFEPKPGMHVYAPGAEKYRVIRLLLEPQPYLTVLPMSYPESEIYYFEPFDERVPVYQKPFSLVQELVLEGTLEAQAQLRGRENVTVAGTLEYQACSDTICYPPQSVALSWTLALRPLAFGGPPRR